MPMVYVSHDPQEIRAIASRVVRIDDGRVSATGGVELLDAAPAGVLA
jgi:molybdate transport system ATP-binding protein